MNPSLRKHLKSPCPGKGGFTLLELLIVIAILSAVTTMGVVAFSGMTSAWQDTRTLIDLDDIASRAFEAMREDFSDIISAELTGIPIRGIQRATQDPRFFQMDLADDQIILPIQTSGIGVRQLVGGAVRYGVERQEGGGGKLIRWVGELGADMPMGAKQVIIDRADVVRLQFEYLAEGGDEWRTEWLGDELPKAVRVSMTLVDPNRPWVQIARKAVFTVHVT